MSSNGPPIPLHLDLDDESLRLIPPSSADRSPLRSWRTANDEGVLYHHFPSSDGVDFNTSLQPALSFTSVSKHSRRHSSISESDVYYHKRTINPITLGCVAYFAVAAGPFGIEAAVRAAGAYPVLIAVLILPFTWGLPQALMTAELSTMIDENGGYILWVRRGLGEYAGWVNAFNSIACNICDLPTYPVLFCSYVEAFLMSGYGYALSHTEKWMVKGFALSFVFISNAVGMRAVALSSVIMVFFVLAPFLLEPLCIDTFNVAVWGASTPNINWSLFLSTIMWNYQGWDSLGCIAGEVKDSGRTYPIAILIAIGLISINYAFPIAVGVMIEPNFSTWGDGSLESIAMKIASWLGVWVGAAAVVATLGEFNVVMACSSRALWATADFKMLPKWLSYEWERFGTPIAAVIFQSITTAILMSFSFEFLVVIDTFFNNLTLLIEFFAFLRLKYIEADTYRPFEVPFGRIGAWTITLPKVAVLLCALFMQGWKYWLFCGLFNTISSIVYLVWKRHQIRSSPDENTPFVNWKSDYGITKNA